MFLVKDTSSAREARIQAFIADDPSLAALLAIVHVEWTLRRVIIALGSSPNIEVRRKLEHCHGHDKYRDLWKEEVTPRTGARLSSVVQNWDGLVRAFRLRHVLVHGVRSVTHDYAAERALWALGAAADVRAFCAAHGVDIDSRLPVRRR
jgi:hypothetical protein